MGLSKVPRFAERNASRAALFALLLPALAACDSGEKTPQQVQPTVSASASVFASATAVISSSASASTSASAAPVALGPIEEPVMCVNGRLSNDREDNINPRVRKGLEGAGADVYRVNPDNFKSFRNNCNGIMVVGGNDIDTRIIPQSAPLHPKAKLMSAQRQAFDRIFIEWARKNKVPILAECLGAQEVAVWEGEGSGLVQHIPDVSGAVKHRGRHMVELDEKASVFGLGRNPKIRSNHHQAPKGPLPDTLEVVGRTKDGMIEAFISTDETVWGFHWHPRQGSEQEIYRNFVSMVKEKGYRSPAAKKLARQKQRVGVSPAKPAETVEDDDSLSPYGVCPPDMVKVKSFCVDRFESSLVDTVKSRHLSHCFSPVKSYLLMDFKRWTQKAGTSEKPENSGWKGSILDATMKVPSPYAWQLTENVEARALSINGAYPSGFLSQKDAKNVCKNSRKRLCTNKEWETACRGEEDRDHPYGDKFKFGQCNVFRFAHPGLSLHGRADINHRDPRFPLVKDASGNPLLRRTGATSTCVSKWGDDGIRDMVGNIDEWVGDSPVFRGGFYSRSTKDGCSAALGLGHAKGYYDYSLGARCCKDATE